MKLYFAAFILLVSFHYSTSFKFDDFLDKFFGSEKFAEFKEKLRNHRIKIREFLNETRGHWRELDRNGDDLFNAAVDELHVNVDNNTDKTIKRRKFSKNLELAENLTKKHKNAFFGITPFSFMDINEFKKDYLMKPIKIKNLSTENTTKIDIHRKKRQIQSVDLRTNNAVAPIRSQGSCGGCWAFVTASTMETSYYQKYKMMIDLSEQQLINCDDSNYGCNGGWMSTAYTYAQQGVAQEYTAPYLGMSNTCNLPTGKLVKVIDYGQLYPNDPNTMKYYLQQGYSLSVAIQASTPEFLSYTSGILDNPVDCTDDAVDHAVVIIGYGTERGIPYWIVRNSWGTYWGEDGYFRVKIGINYCNIETYPFYVNVI